MTHDELGLFLEDDRTSFKPGETLPLSVLWALPETPRSLEVRLFFHTRGKGTEDIQVAAVQPITANASAGEAAVKFLLPAAPYSFSGKLISVLWSVELVAQPGDRATSCDFVLSPTGKEYLLNEIR